MKPRVLFFSAAEISIPCLEVLKRRDEVDFVGIITQPERARGRGQQIRLNPIGLWAEQQGIPFFQAEKMDNSAYEWLSAKQPDLIFVMAFGHILSERFLTLPPLGMWNFHTSLLPKYRGASPIQTAILNGEAFSGVTLMSVVKKMDAGAWLAQKKIALDASETTPSLTEKMAKASAELLEENLPALLARNYTLTEQNPIEVTFCSKYTKADGELDFSKPAEVLERQIRAFQPWPGSYFFKNNERYIVHRAHAIAAKNASQNIGHFCVDSERKSLYVTTSSGNLHFEILQKSGGKPLSIADFLRGDRNF
jgi:methionyl-tRNA formyltransferase